MHSAALRDTRGHLDVARTLNRAAVEGYDVERIGDTDPETDICRDLDDGFTTYMRRKLRRNGRPMPVANTHRFVWITLDPQRGRALVTGQQGPDVVKAAGVPVLYVAKGRHFGPVIAIEHVADVHAAGQHLGVVVRDRKADA